MTPTLRLAKWLGPWASSSSLPRAVSVSDVDIEGPESTISVKIYRPTKSSIRGVYLVSQGLHFLGPDDPRMDRFCRVLSNAGFEVVAPRLPSYMSMRLRPLVNEEFKRVFLSLDALTTVKARPAVFSISFGSLPVLRLASDPAFNEHISAVITFGGYADWIAALYYTIRGKVETQDGVFERMPDPLNQPAIFMNLLEGMDVQAAEAQVLHQTWFEYLRRTWGNEECKERAVHQPIAEELANGLGDALRALFMLGCGLGDQEEALSLCLEANSRRPDLGAALDVASYLSEVRAPVYLFHGLDDDVFPFTQMEMLKNAFSTPTKVQTYLTGLYGHTGTQAGPKGGLMRELRTMLGMLNVLANAPERPSS